MICAKCAGIATFIAYADVILICMTKGHDSGGGNVGSTTATLVIVFLQAIQPLAVFIMSSWSIAYSSVVVRRIESVAS
jgi:uncharacterized protein (DUF983 family)